MSKATDKAPAARPYRAKWRVDMGDRVLKPGDTADLTEAEAKACGDAVEPAEPAKPDKPADQPDKG